MLDEIIRRRRALHMIPETAFDLELTKDYLLNEIERWSCVVEEIAKCGIACFFDAGKEQTYVFRSDMDALNISENTSVDYCSKHGGKMHACGHDGHMAMLLALGDWVNENIRNFKRNVLLIFQPAEELALGATEVIRSGVLDKYRATRAYALHVDPWTAKGCIATRPGPMMARSSEVYITFNGKSTHAAMSEKGADALAAMCEFIYSALEMERGIDKAIPRLLKFGILKSGTAVNIISDKATVGGTMRTFSDELFIKMRDRLYEIADLVNKKYSTTSEIELINGAGAVINDEALYDEAKKALSGLDFVTLDKPTMIAEDFAMFGKVVPSLMLFVGIGSGIPLHSEKFVMDEKALEYGAKALIRLANY